MNIIYIAYSCNPYEGSEDKIGWNIPLECSKHGEDMIYVITKEEQREFIEKYLQENTNVNIRFLYVDIPKVYKKIFKGALYTGRLNVFHKRALKLVKKICKSRKIDIIHQITPIEFRSVGNYKIQNIKFVLGPIGGGEYIPAALSFYIKRHWKIEFFRKVINTYYKYKIKFKKIDYIMFANNETKTYLMKNKSFPVIPENGITENEINMNRTFKQQNTIFLVIGRLVYRKGHDFLLDAVEKIPDEYDYKIRIIGIGDKYQQIKTRIDNSIKLSNHVELLGSINHVSINKEYENADVLIMPSLRETSGTVIFEAMANKVPVITINRFGASLIVNNKNGYLYDGVTKEDFIDSICDCIEQCLKDKKTLREKAEKSIIDIKNYTYHDKLRIYYNIYENLL